MTPLSVVLVLGAFGAAGGSLALAWWLWDYREEHGGRWLFATICIQFLLTASYGVGYLIADQTASAVIEALFWILSVWLGVLFLGFALAYTGRGRLLGTSLFQTVVGVAVALTLLAASNPLHGLLWMDFRVESIGSIATVEYTRGVLVFLVFLFAALTTAAASFLLFDTVVSYGPLYRGEAAAVGVSTIPPAAGFLLWLLNPAPISGLNLTPLLFIPHLVFDAYAFAASDMFDFHPATRRESERAALDDLGAPVVIVDVQGRAVNLNDAAESLFSIEKRDALARPLSEFYDGDPIDPDADEQTTTIRQDNRRRQFKITSTRLETALGAHVGYTVIFQDITDEREREQQLQVFNRILRHNLRNEMMVIRGFTDDIREETDDDSIREKATLALASANDLLDIGEKARNYAAALERRNQREQVSIAPSIEAVASDIRERYPEGTLSVSIPESLVIETNRELLELVFENLVENGFEHADSEAPSVEIEFLRTEDETAFFAVRDDGPGIPQLELDTIAEGAESSLQHGQGLGLWIIVWGAAALGGTVRFETDGDGTTAEIEVPGVEAE